MCVIAMAVTRNGVPVRCWTFPGNTADTAIIRTVKDDVAGWNHSRHCRRTARDLAQDFVPTSVAEPVRDRLEVVDVAEQHGDEAGVAAGETLLETVPTVPTVTRFARPVSASVRAATSSRRDGRCALMAPVFPACGSLRQPGGRARVRHTGRRGRRAGPASGVCDGPVGYD
jgi:hypothetical protein